MSLRDLERMSFKERVRGDALKPEHIKDLIIETAEPLFMRADHIGGSIEIAWRRGIQEGEDTGKEPLRAIAFALTIDDRYDMWDFLNSWTHGDTSEWPEFEELLK